MFVPICLCACEREKWRGFEKAWSEGVLFPMCSTEDFSFP